MTQSTYSPYTQEDMDALYGALDQGCRRQLEGMTLLSFEERFLDFFDTFFD